MDDSSIIACLMVLGIFTISIASFHAVSSPSYNEDVPVPN